jgi:hypothetical protein
MGRRWAGQGDGIMIAPINLDSPAGVQPPPEPVVGYEAGEENLYLTGLSGRVYYLKCYPCISTTAPTA